MTINILRTDHDATTTRSAGGAGPSGLHRTNDMEDNGSVRSTATGSSAGSDCQESLSVALRVHDVESVLRQ